MCDKLLVAGSMPNGDNLCENPSGQPESGYGRGDSDQSGLPGAGRSGPRPLPFPAPVARPATAARERRVLSVGEHFVLGKARERNDAAEFDGRHAEISNRLNNSRYGDRLSFR
jgi:hypothetical protein